MRPYRTLRWLAAMALSLMPLLPAGAETAPAAPANADIQQLVATLKDDKARAQLIDQLQTLLAAQNAESTDTASESLPWLSGLAAQLDAVGGEVLATVPIVAQAPRLFAWVETQATDVQLRQRWLDIIEKLATIFGAGLVADWLARWLLRRPAARLQARTSEHLAAKLLLLALAAIVEALPVLIFAAVATFVMPLTEPHTGTRGVAGVVIAATVWARGLLAIARVALLAPVAQTLYSLTEETRNYLYIWIRRFVQWAAYGYAASLGAWWLGAPGAINGLLMRIAVLVLAILAIIFVLQNRIAVSEWVRGRDAADKGRWRILRLRLAETWHVLAIVYVVGTFGVYMLNSKGGLGLLLRATALSLVVITTAAILVRFLDELLQRGLAVKPDLKARFPTLEARANRYTPILRMVSTLTIYVVAGLALLQAWGIEAFTWIANFARYPAAGHAVSLVVVIVGGLVLWEFFSSTIERRLAAIDYSGRSRARTLLPLLRTTVLIILLTVAGLMVMSEVGLNIAPLLAGAGIAGVAVGFGAQTLVKDIITGFFFLLEDTFAVGDLVDVGKGHVGTIETMSIRNFQLRDVAGIVHTIPFSEVSTVLNMSRDFAYVVCDVGVLYREDPDRVIEVIHEAGKELSEDPQWSRYILAPLEIIGVDRFTDTGMVIRARIKTAPPHQLEMGREFNLRLKKAFDRRGIALASANQLNYLDNPPHTDPTTRPAPAPAVKSV
jgi:moderate conductance mechanosensitive channel